MRVHDDADIGVRLPGGASRPKDVQAEDVAHALKQPKQASVQTMLEVQRLAGNSGVSRLLQREEDGAKQASPVLDVVGQGGGNPLNGSLKNEMEGRLGADFSDVKVHTDSKASESARAVQANAYTVGSDVVVRQDRWSPETDDGKKTIAHELTHVVQQRNGPVAGTSTGTGISVSDPGDPYERAAEATANSVMAKPATAAPAASAQLHADDDVQRLVAQREAAPEEEEETQMQREAAPEEEEETQMQRQSAAPEEEEEAAKTPA
jgi:hypothetical protein